MANIPLIFLSQTFIETWSEDIFLTLDIECALGRETHLKVSHWKKYFKLILRKFVQSEHTYMIYPQVCIFCNCTWTTLTRQNSQLTFSNPGSL